MEAINTTLFYIMYIAIALGAICSFIMPNIIWSISSAVAVFWAVGGIFFLLKAPYLGAAQILLWGVGVAILLMFGVMLVNKEEYAKRCAGFKLKAKNIISIVLFIVFGSLISTFIIEYLPKNDILYIELPKIAEGLFNDAVVSFELVGVLLFITLIGIGALFLTKKVEK